MTDVAALRARLTTDSPTVSLTDLPAYGGS